MDIIDPNLIASLTNMNRAGKISVSEAIRLGSMMSITYPPSPALRLPSPKP